MKLIDLDPRWLVDDGRKVGFVFKSPTDQSWWQTCFFEAGRRTMCCDREDCRQADRGDCPHSQLGLAEAAGVSPDRVQPCRRECAWQAHGDLNFETLTITPSLDGSAGGLWHGFITNGEIR